MQESFLILLILGVTVLLSGTLMGVYRVLKPIFGYSNDRLFGSFEQGKDLFTTTGILPLLILRAGMAGVIVAFIWSKIEQTEKNATIFLFSSIIICGIIALVQHKLVKTAVNKHLVQRLGGKVSETSGVVAGAIIGVLLGVMIDVFFILFNLESEPGTFVFVGVLIGVSSGKLLGKLGDNELVETRINEMLTRTAEEIATWGLVGGGVGGIFSIFVDDSVFVVFGVISGVLVGIAYGITAVLLLLFARAFSRIMFLITAPLLILLKFKTIICNRCLRYTESLKSRYEEGRRYCEHCHKEVEYTRDPGAVMLTFGNYAPSKLDERTFILFDPDFEQKEHPIDVSEVYIDTNTADRRLLERFMTYIVNYPPKHGMESVQIFYRGELDELGENLKNVLRNNFENIEGIR